MSSFLLQDLRYAARALAKRPLYGLVTVAVLALAIGANTTVFSVFNGFFLRPLPYPDDDRLVTIHNSYPRIGLDVADVSIPDYLDWRGQAPSLEEIAIYTGSSQTLSGEGPPEQLSVIRATPSLFDVLGVAPSVGRRFTDDDATVGSEQVAVLSHTLWSTRFGARAAVVGEDVRLDGRSFRVIGVMPEGFGFPSSDVDVWAPFAFTPQQASDAERGNEFSLSIGRLRPGASLDGLDAELDAIVRRNAERIPEAAAYFESTGFTARARFLRDAVVGDLARMMTILQSIVFAVLLIACANVANLQLARMAARRRELSLRAALGAERGRLARLVLVESLLLALAGAGIGLAIAHGGLELVERLGLDRAREGFVFALDVRVLAFTAGLTVLATLAFGLLPAMASLRADLARSIQHADRLGGGSGAHLARHVLVVAQIGISVALLVGAGLLTKSFYALQREGPGFEAENVWTARIALPETRYDGAATTRFYEQALAALRALPGVAEAGFTSSLPFDGSTSQGSNAVDGYDPGLGGAEPHSNHRIISEGYLPSLGIPVIIGRNFRADEPERVAIVDEIMAQKYWPEGNALGQRVRRFFDAEWYTIVGVVPAIKHTSLAEDPSKETIYWHYAQRPRAEGLLTLRTTLAPEQLTRSATAVIRGIDPDVPLFNAAPMTTRVVRTLGPQRAPMVLTLVFAAIAFALAVVGIYSVLTWAVTQRVGEIGVRMALGARSRDIVRMVVSQGGKVVAIGLVLGVAGALALGRALSSQIHDVSPTDPAVFAIAVIGLAAAALVATWVPARRASRVDPMRSLRAD